MICHLRSGIAPNTSRPNRHIIIPKRIRIPAIRLPTKINRRNLRHIRTPRPLRRIGIRGRRSHRQPRDGIAIQPRLNRAVGANVVLETLPASRGEGFGGGDPLGGEVGQGGVVGFAVVHEDGGLAADAEVFVCSLGGVELGDEGHVVGGESGGGFSGLGVSEKQKRQQKRREGLYCYKDNETEI